MDRYKLIYDWVPESSPRVLDIGCGNGNFTKWLTGKAPDVVGLDHNVSQVTEAIASFDGISGVAASAEDLPFPTSTFDAVIMSDVLEHLDNPGNALQEALRVLSDDGVLITSLPNTGPLAVLDGDNIVNRFVWMISRLRIPKSRGTDGAPRHFYDGFVFRKHRHFGKREIEEMLNGAGLIERHFYGGGLLWPLCYLLEKVLEVFFKKSLVRSDYRILRRIRALDLRTGMGKWSYNLIVAIRKAGITQRETQS
jgi:ubiquinone/menaquinone biosynthesis C-methylase UbiE